MDCIKYQNFLVSCIFKFLRPAQRFEDFKHKKISRKAACHGIAEHLAYLSSLKKQQNCCRLQSRCHHLGYSAPPAHHCTI